jgi:hypothetical protein
MSLVFDHLIVGARTLAEGQIWAKATLGVEVPFGGRHPLMGTHNLLTALGPDSFLEIIAIDPDSPAPDRARWFALDRPAMQARLAEGPRPIAWMAGTDSLDDTLAQARTAGVDIGPAVTVTRGDLSWRVTVRNDGALLEGGTVPLVIAWPGAHPAPRMPDLGLRLQALRLWHPAPNHLLSLLTPIGADALPEIEASGDGTQRVGADLVTADGSVVTL